jgi:hypothetical protein
MEITTFQTVEKLFNDELYRKIDEQYREVDEKYRQNDEKYRQKGEQYRQKYERYRQKYEEYRQTLHRKQTNINICCDDQDETDIIIMKNYIKQVPKYQTLSDRDIFVVLIELYYSLRLHEQTEEWLEDNFFKLLLFNRGLGISLYNDIAAGDIMLFDKNLSSSIRRHIMEINGGKITKNRRTKNRRTKQ